MNEVLEQIMQDPIAKRAYEYINGDSEDWMKVKKSKNGFVLTTDYAYCEINFYYINEMILCEFSIPIPDSMDLDFYLHFQVIEFDRFIELYNEMKIALMSKREKRKFKILFTCTSGATTNMFAFKLQEVANTLNLEYECSAVGYYSLYRTVEEGDYDLILMAPQVSQYYETARQVLQDKEVCQIPDGIFGSFDYTGLALFVEELRKKKQKKERNELELMDYQLANNYKILVLVIMPNKIGLRIWYRVYEDGNIILQNQIIHAGRTYTIQDMEDIIDVVLSLRKKIDAIGISMPGIIADGKVTLLSQVQDLGFDTLEKHKYYDEKEDWYDLQKYLEGKYHLPVFLDNNVNSAALGYQYEHREYKNLVFHSQPFGRWYGGQGIVTNGKLLRSESGLVGEISLVNKIFPILKKENDVFTTEGMLDLISNNFLMDIAILAPEIIVYRCNLVPDTEVLRQRLLEYVGKERFLPKLVRVTNAEEYMLTGHMRHCLHELNLLQK